jgi:DNA-binding XRE family transcriptional regulator
VPRPIRTIRELRKQSGLTQAEFASKIGWDSKTISAWETSGRGPRLLLRKSEGPFADPLAYEEEVLDTRTLRLRAQMTQQELAEKIGVDTRTVSNWETGKHLPKLLGRPGIQEDLAKVLGIGGNAGGEPGLPFITPSSLKARLSLPESARLLRVHRIRRRRIVRRRADRGNSEQLEVPSREDALKEVAIQLARLIESRVIATGTSVSRTAPVRTAPENLTVMLGNLLRIDPLTCGLCGGRVELRPKNRLLQPSCDRVDSRIADYGPGNIQLVHLGCNLGKSDASMEEYREWLGIARKAGVAV